MAPVARRPCAISSHGRWRAARGGKIRHVRAPATGYARLKLRGLVFKFHQLQGAAFPDICGRLTQERPTWDHVSNDRGDARYMHAANLRPASHSEQALNRTTCDNPVEGRRRGAGVWECFPNPGRAAAILRERFPRVRWDESGIHSVANIRGGCTHHHGWEFRWPAGARPVRNATSAPTEAQWRDDGAYADEHWAHLEPLGGARFLVTPEHRDGSLGAPFEVDVREFQDGDGEESDDEGARARL